MYHDDVTGEILYCSHMNNSLNICKKSQEGSTFHAITSEHAYVLALLNSVDIGMSTSTDTIFHTLYKIVTFSVS